MNLLKVSSICKCCGAELDPAAAVNSIIRCDACDMQQTIYMVDNYEKQQKHKKAAALLQESCFDRAHGIFNELLTVEPEDPEINWNICLCRYGISYVDDKRTGKKVPTCHRTLRQSVFSDANYQTTIRNAGEEAKQLYQRDAAYIDIVQTRIRKLASKEEPYDIFICYKKSAADGSPTTDSVYAHEIYERLTDMGYKVFFAEVTLSEEKAGEAYEPIIYSALSTSKVMLLLLSDPDYAEAPWVRNEWSRYIEMMQQRHVNKYILGCCIGISPEKDMPKELRNINTIDLTSERWQNELTNNIRTILPKRAGSTAAPDARKIADEQLHLEKADRLLEERKFIEAEYEYDRAIKLNLSSGRAYLGTALAANRLRSVYSRNPEEAAEFVARKVKEGTKKHDYLFRELKSGNELAVNCFGSYMTKALQLLDSDALEKLHKELSELSAAAYELYIRYEIAEARESKNSREYYNAIRILEMIEDNREAYELYRECCYLYGKTCSGLRAAEYFVKAKGYEDSQRLADEIYAKDNAEKLRKKREKECPELLEKLKNKYKNPDPNENSIFADFTAKWNALKNAKYSVNTIIIRVVMLAVHFIALFAFRSPEFVPEETLTMNSVIGCSVPVLIFLPIPMFAFAIFIPGCEKAIIGTAGGLLAMFGAYFGISALTGNFSQLTVDGSLYEKTAVYFIILVLSVILLGIIPSIINVRKVREFKRIQQEYENAYKQFEDAGTFEMEKFAKIYLHPYKADKERYEMRKILDNYKPEDIMKEKIYGK